MSGLPNTVPIDAVGVWRFVCLFMHLCTCMQNLVSKAQCVPVSMLFLVPLLQLTTVKLAGGRGLGGHV